MCKKLKEALVQYSITFDENLITEDVYQELQLFCRSVVKKFIYTNPKYLDFDDTMGICNVAIWTALKQYNHEKASPLTFLTKVIENAILMDIRKDKKYANVQLSYLSDEVKEADGLTIEDVIEDDSIYNRIEDIVMYNEVESIIKRTLDEIYEEKQDGLYSRLHDMFNMRVKEEKTMQEIADITGYSKPYVCRIMKYINKRIYEELQFELYNKPKGEVKKKSKRVICLTTGIVYPTIQDAANKCGINAANLCSVCKGRHTTSGSLPDGTRLKWMYYDEYLNKKMRGEL